MYGQAVFGEFIAGRVAVALGILAMVKGRGLALADKPVASASRRVEVKRFMMIDGSLRWARMESKDKTVKIV